MPQISVDIWYQIMLQLRNCASLLVTPVDLVRLSAVCRQSRQIFLSDTAWAKFNPYGLDEAISRDFNSRLERLNPKQRREMYLVWQLFGCRWKWEDYISDYGNPYGVPDNLYHKLAVVAFVETNFGFQKERDYNLMRCAVQLNPTNIRKTDTSIELFRDLVIIAVSHQPSLFNEIPQLLRDDEEVLLVALRNEPPSNAKQGKSVLKAASDRLLASTDFLTKACALNTDYEGYFGTFGIDDLRL